VASLLAVANAPSAVAADIKLNIVALGDSYTAGTGGLDYYGINGCYKSRNTYAELYARSIGGGIDVNFTNLACNGAVVGDVYGQIDQLSQREKDAVDLVFITIGGNDANFKGIIEQCLVGLIDDFGDCVKNVENANDDLVVIADKVKTLLLHSHNYLPNAKIVLVGYPNVIGTSNESCQYIHELPGLEFHSGTAILQLAYQYEAEQLNLVDVLNRNYPNQFEFISLKALFRGHEQCEDGDLWIRGTGDTPITSEWWHPNVEGYTAIAKYLKTQDVYRGEEDIFRYGNLPFACGATVPYASTYNLMSDGERTWSHSNAIDLPMPSGTMVTAAASGTARVYYSASLGNYVDVHGVDGVLHRTAHMQSAGLVQDGTYVYQGQPIGKAGTSGNTTGPHVHYEQHVSNGMRIVSFDGPALEWGPNQSGSGDRTTTHTLESGNCGTGGGVSSSTAGSLSTSELFIYNSESGHVFTHDVRTDGSQSVIGNGSWKEGWDIIVNLEIDGDSGSEILFYDSDATSTRGTVSVYQTDSTGLSSRLWKAAWSAGWSHVVPVDLDGDGKDEVIVYNMVTGRYFFLNVRADGSMVELSGGNWTPGWETIIALELGGSRGEEVLFYKEGSSRGVAKIYNTTNTRLDTKLNQVSWVNGWDFIVPVDIEGDGKDELVLYRPKDGKYFLMDMSSKGSPTALATGKWSQGWDIIQPVEIDGDKLSEIMFYNSESTETRGKVKFYNMSLTGVSGPIAEFAWSRGWTVILPVQLPQR